MSHFTVLGGGGFIGSNLVRYLAPRATRVDAPRRDEPLKPGNLGHVIYCIGLTADFRERPVATMQAHVAKAAEILRTARFESFLYLSSTRVYGGAKSTAETSPVEVDPTAPDQLYNISKLAGEALCLALPNPRVRVARLSNVFGPGMGGKSGAAGSFLASVLHDAVEKRFVEFQTSLASAKDYISVADVVRALERIALAGEERLYNVASGRNVTHKEIAEALRRVCGTTVVARPGAPTTAYPEIATGRITALFEGAKPKWAPADLIENLPALISGNRSSSVAGAA